MQPPGQDLGSQGQLHRGASSCSERGHDGECVSTSKETCECAMWSGNQACLSVPLSVGLSLRVTPEEEWVISGARGAPPAARETAGSGVL